MAPRIPIPFIEAIIGTAFIIEVAGVIRPPPVRRRRPQAQAAGRHIRHQHHRRHLLLDRDIIRALPTVRGNGRTSKVSNNLSANPVLDQRIERIIDNAYHFGSSESGENKVR